MLEDKEMQVFQFSAKLWLIVKKNPVANDTTRNARGKPTTFGRVLTNSFRISEALGSSNIENAIIENQTRNLRSKMRVL